MSVPKHIAFIMDGNRRFSKRLMLKPWKGHEWGVEKVRAVLDWCEEAGIQEVTLYTFSVENFNRPKQEFEYLMDLFIKEFKNLQTHELLDKHEIRVNIIGRIHLFPKELQDLMYGLMEKTKNYKKRIVNLAMAYGGRSEVVDAARKIAHAALKGEIDVESINEETFKENLYLDSDPDLIIRTGGERRMSNFLPYQGAYAELIFMDKMWPEIEKEDFLEAIAEYGRRHRRFGR